MGQRGPGAGGMALGEKGESGEHPGSPPGRAAAAGLAGACIAPVLRVASVLQVPPLSWARHKGHRLILNSSNSLGSWEAGE